MVEDDREEGEREREVESERRRWKRDDGDTGKTMKHKGKHEPKSNQFFKFNICFSSHTDSDL